MDLTAYKMNGTTDTGSDIDDKFNALIDALEAEVEARYPIGKLYFSTVSTNPATILGFGTWTAFGTGKIPIGVDTGDSDFDTVEKTGGAKTKTIAEANLPAHVHSNGTLAIASDGAHTHTVTGGTGSGSNISIQGGSGSISTSSSGAHTHSITGSMGSIGSGTALDIMPPTITVYMFKRVS